MSAVALELGHSVYIPSSPLPPNARADLAFMQVMPVQGGASTATYTVSGNYYEIPVASQGDFTTDGNAGNRIVDLAATDANGQTLWSVISPATQAASLTYEYVWTPTTTTPYAVGTGVIMALPGLALIPGSRLVYEATNHMAGDKWANLVLTVIRIPTGPAPTSGATELVPTPLLV